VCEGEVMYVKRDLAGVFKKSLKQFPAILITGPRQSGKTTFLKNELGSSYSYTTFDDPVERAFAKEDPNGFIDQFGDKNIVLDEIQYVPELLSYIKMRIDEERTPGRFILTGSQQFNMMKGISESLAGRIAIFNLFPFSFNEQTNNENIESLLYYGGYPELSLFPDRRDVWLSSYMQTYLERDVRQLIKIKDLGLFQTFLMLCAAQHGQELNISKLSKQCGISSPTAKEWISILEASFIITLLKPYYTNMGKRVIKSPKLYFVDSSIPAYLTRQADSSSLFNGAMGGEFFEGFIVTEVLKEIKNSFHNSDIYYWRSHDQLEVDLIIETDGAIYPIEIKKTATPTHKHAAGLIKFKDLFGEKSRSGFIVCNTNKEVFLSGNVKAMNWYGFLQNLQFK
jgi:uncharacterized protein